MGRYLAMGLIHEIVTSRDEIRKKNISNEELRQEIEQTMLLDIQLYDETETDRDIVFTLKNQVLERYLIPFLEAFYPIVYRYDHDEYLKLLQELRTTQCAQWIDLADMKGNYTFRLDKYGESLYLRFSTKGFHPTICLDFKTLMLYMGDGKILTEGISNFLIFFKHCINETFKEYPIAKSMHVYITG
jgi:hypothetical protein